MTLPWVLIHFTWPFKRRRGKDPASQSAQPGIGYPLKTITRTGGSICNQLHWKSKIQNPKSKEPEELPKGLQMMRHHRFKTKPSASAQTKKVTRRDLECLSQNETIDIYPRPKTTRRSSEYQVLKQNHRHIPETKIHTYEFRVSSLKTKPSTFTREQESHVGVPNIMFQNKTIDMYSRHPKPDHLDALKHIHRQRGLASISENCMKTCPLRQWGLVTTIFYVQNRNR